MRVEFERRINKFGRTYAFKMVTERQYKIDEMSKMMAEMQSAMDELKQKMAEPPKEYSDELQAMLATLKSAGINTEPYESEQKKFMETMQERVNTVTTNTTALEKAMEKVVV